MHVSFVLNKRNEPRTSVMILCRWAGKTYKASTGEIVLSSGWDAGRQRMKKTVPGAHATNAILANLETRMVESWNEFKFQTGRIPDVREFKSFLEKGNVQEGPMDYFKRFVQNARVEVNHRTGRVVAQATLLSYGQAYNRIAQFERERRKITWDGLDLDWYREFLTWCAQKELSVNTTGSTIKVLKVVLREAESEGYPVNPAYKSSKFKKVKEPSSRIALTTADIEKLVTVELNGLMAELRDIFVFACFTALRFRDWEKIPEMLQRDVGMVELSRQYKTSKPALIPVRNSVMPLAQRFAEGFKYHDPFPRNVQTVDERLKVVARKAGLMEMVRQEITRGGVRVTTHVPKWQLVGTHTARRTFATLTYLSGFNGRDLAHIMGLSSENELRTYMKIGPVDEATRLRRHWEGLE